MRHQRYVASIFVVFFSNCSLLLYASSVWQYYMWRFAAYGVSGAGNQQTDGLMPQNNSASAQPRWVAAAGQLAGKLFLLWRLVVLYNINNMISTLDLKVT